MTDYKNLKFIYVVGAEDDLDDQLTIKRAFKKQELSEPFFAENGKELLDYLQGSGQYEGKGKVRPNLILLDLNMPVMDGYTTLHILKENEELKELPVIIFTTSDSESDIKKSYQLGANSYVVKPYDYKGLVKVIGKIKDYWFKTVEIVHYERK